MEMQQELTVAVQLLLVSGMKRLKASRKYIRGSKLVMGHETRNIAKLFFLLFIMPGTSFRLGFFRITSYNTLSIKPKNVTACFAAKKRNLKSERVKWLLGREKSNLINILNFQTKRVSKVLLANKILWSITESVVSR